MIGLSDIQAARARIAGSIFVTPCARSESVSKLTGNTTFFKLENLHMTGSFKERGALNKLLVLSPEERAAGVIAASAGNHAQGVAYHAARQGVRAVIVMPVTAPLIKISSTREHGAEVILHGRNYDEAFEEADRRCRAEGLTFIHPFDDDAVIAGQGTLGLELLEAVPDLDAVVVPVGGGGLIAGVACAVKETNPAIRVVGVQAAALATIPASLAAGQPVTLPAASTIADGIAVRRPGDRPFPMVARYVDELVTVDDEEIANAILVLLEREKTLAEGAGAAGVAALLQHKTSLAGRKVAAVVAGGNIDVNFLSRIIERGLVKDRRLVRLRMPLADHAGELARLATVISAERANIMEINHDRAYLDVALGQCMVEVTLEMHGREHLATLITALEAAGYRPDRVL